MSNTDDRNRRELPDQGREAPEEAAEPREKYERRLGDAMLKEMAERKLEIFLKQHSMKEIAELNPELKEDILKEALIEVFKDEADQEAFSRSPIITSSDGLEYERTLRGFDPTSSLIEQYVRPGASLADMVVPLEPYRPLDPAKPGLEGLTVAEALGDRIRPPLWPPAIRPGVQLSVSSRLLEQGQTMSIYASPYPNVSNKAVDWNSSNYNVASVSQLKEYSFWHHLVGEIKMVVPLPPGEGLIKARSVGTATISAQSHENGATGAVDIEVQIFPKSMTIETEWDYTLGGRPNQFTAIVLPTNATDKSVTWESTHPEIASITDTGVLMVHHYMLENIGYWSVSIIARTNVGGITAVSRIPWIPT